MAPLNNILKKLKWNTLQRLQYIEITSFYTGVVTRSDVAKAFGISDAAATKDLSLYGQIAPNNLNYKQNVFGFVPSQSFKEVVTDLSPSLVLSMIADNSPATGGPYGKDLIYGVSVDTLPRPSRLPSKDILAQVIRATKNKKKLNIVYSSLSNRESDQPRIIEPHSLINTGLRWHLRAYNEDTFDFRDFVLSRISKANMLDVSAESSEKYDDDWIDTVEIELKPHPKLNDKKRLSLLFDYGVTGESIRLNVRRALLGYALQKLFVDTTTDHSLDPNAYQLIVANREEIEPFAGWAFLK